MNVTELKKAQPCV